MLVLAGVLALTVKLSAAPLFLMALPAAWFHRKTAGVPLVKPLAVAAVLLGLWMARGVVLSGCAAYPLPQSCAFDLPWAVSRSQPQAEAFSIRSWARAPHRFDRANVMADWKWLGPWAVNAWQDWSARLCLFGAIAGGVSMLFGARVSRMAMAAFAGLCLCLAYWFWSAPDVRFGNGYMAVAGVLGLSVACTVYFPDSGVLRRLILEAVAVSVLVGTVGLARYGNTWTVKSRPAFVMRTAPGGKSISVTAGDREGSDQCWDRPLPCTPNFDPESLKRVRWR
jgi:hypothetical protein